MSQIFSNLECSIFKLYNLIMCNLYIKFVKFLEICKQFSHDLVTEKGNILRPGPVPRFSDLEVIALSMAAETEEIDSENWLFEARLKECRDSIPNLISRRQFNDRRKAVSGLQEQIRSRMAHEMDGGEEYLHRLQAHRGMPRGSLETLRDGTGWRLRQDPGPRLLCIAGELFLRVQASCTLWIKRCHTFLRPLQGECTQYQLYKGHKV